MTPDLQGLNLIELLDLLEPAPEPPPVSLMPQTAGWIWLGLALLAGLALLIRAVLRHRRANAYRRAGLAALAGAGDDPARIAPVLRRTALAGFPRTEVAGLTGADWLAFLDRTLPGAGFTDGPGRVLAEAPYREVPAPPGLAALARRWIRSHDTGVRP
jgi:hypothetical protein